MCGISGFLGDLNDSPNSIKIKRTLHLMTTRGPDSKNFWKKNIKKKNITLLHSRLSIIDPSIKASQPFIDEEGIIIFNGIIYNYLELKKNLILKGCKFKTNSDTEVLLKFLNKYGPSKINELEGMWSFAYLNFKKKKLVLSRDRFGEKPLYFKYQKKSIIFGSNLNYINSLSKNKDTINNKKVENYIKFGWRTLVSTTNTLYNDIKTLQPGTNLEIDFNLKKTIKTYWHPKSVKIDNNLDYENERLKLKKLILNEFDKKLRTDFPIACLLSGGIDSSVIASVSNIISKKKIDCFSIKALDKNYDESDLIKKNIKHIGCKHRYIKIDKDNNLKELIKLIKKTSSVVPSVTWLLYAIMCKNIKKLGYKVILSGIGGDEMFAGYYIHHLHYLESIYNNSYFSTEYSHWKKNTAAHIRSKNLKDFKSFLKKNNLKNKAFSEVLELSKYFKHFNTNNLKSKKYLNDKFKNELFKDLFYQSLPTQLYGADNISMYYGLESRSPFLSKDIYSKSFSYPNKFLIRRGIGKEILRSSMKNIVDRSVLESSNKIGFYANLKSFFDLKSIEFKRTLFSNDYINSIIKKKEIEKLLIKKKLSNQETHFIFNTLNMAIFLENRNIKN